ncbi:MAG: hypothetical protein AB1782_15310 [Cyanobacteriota bacterium]
MDRLILFLTAYNIVFTLSRLIFVIADPTNSMLKSLQFYDFAVYVLFPVFILWTLLYLTIPAAIYCGVNGVIKKLNRFHISALTVNSITCITFILLLLSTGTSY